MIGRILQTRGGGNAGNALTAAARLGADCYLVTKLGDDGIGEQIANELSNDGVNLSHVLRAKESVSDFTYLIIDKSGAPPQKLQVLADSTSARHAC